MNKKTEDPRILLYLFDELSESEKSDFEKELTSSPELNKELQEIKQIHNLTNSQLSLVKNTKEDEEFINSLIKTKRNPNYWKWLALASFSFLAIAFIQKIIFQTNDSSITKRNNKTESNQNISKTEISDQETKIKKVSLKKEVTNPYSNIAAALIGGRKGLNDIAPAESNLFGNISKRIQKLNNKGVKFDQKNYYLSAQKAPLISLPTSQTDSLLFQKINLFNFWKNHAALISKTNLGQNTKIRWEQSTNPFQKDSEFIRIHIKVKKDQKVKQFYLKSNQNEVSSYKIIGQKLIIVGEAHGFQIHKERVIKANQNIHIFVEFNRKKILKTNIDGLKLKTQLKNPIEASTLFSISIDDEEVHIYDYPNLYQDSSEDHQWLLGLLGVLYINNPNKKELTRKLLQNGQEFDPNGIRKNFKP